MQVTDEMVRVAVQAMKALEDKATEDPENIFGADLTSLARAAITAALAAMQDHVIVPREPDNAALDAILVECEHAWGMGAKQKTHFPVQGRAVLREIAKPFYRAAVSPAPSQLSKRGDAERDSIQEA